MCKPEVIPTSHWFLREKINKVINEFFDVIKNIPHCDIY